MCQLYAMARNKKGRWTVCDANIHHPVAAATDPPAQEEEEEEDSSLPEMVGLARTACKAGHCLILRRFQVERCLPRSQFATKQPDSSRRNKQIDI